MDEMKRTDVVNEGLGFEMVAASLRADQTDTRAFLAALAVKMEGALPAQTVVERARDGLFKGTTHVSRVQINLSPSLYSIAGARAGFEATRSKIVGGVAIKNEALSLDVWIESLARDLAAYAKSSASARAALERLVT